jgi:hypothetical protein
MKEYRLTAWTELPEPFDKTTYRRMLTDMSQRHMSVAQLVISTGIRRAEVQRFIDLLESRGLLAQRDLFSHETAARPFGGWLRKAFGAATR